MLSVCTLVLYSRTVLCRFGKVLKYSVRCCVVLAVWPPLRKCSGPDELVCIKRGRRTSGSLIPTCQLTTKTMLRRSASVVSLSILPPVCPSVFVYVVFGVNLQTETRECVRACDREHRLLLLNLWTIRCYTRCHWCKCCYNCNCKSTLVLKNSSKEELKKKKKHTNKYCQDKLKVRRKERI